MWVCDDIVSLAEMVLFLCRCGEEHKMMYLTINFLPDVLHSLVVFGFRGWQVLQ